MGWRNLFTIQVNGVNCHLPAEWGQMTVENVSVAMALVHATNTRNCQNSCMSGNSIWSLLTGEARNKVTTYANHYTFDGYISGPVLLLAVIACMHIDTRAVSEHILRDLENLGTVMVQLNSDVQAFNLYVEGKHRELRACGMTDTAAVTHLFQGYEAAADEAFVMWIKCHHDNTDDGTTNLTTDQLMQMATRKYADMLNAGTWAKPNADQERLIALTGEVKKITKSLKNPSQQKDNKGNTNNNNNRSGNRATRPICKEDEWRYVVPLPDAPRTKQRNGQTYHWCPHHNNDKGMWALHLPAGCREKEKKEKLKQNKKNQAKMTTEVKSAIQFNAATTTIENVSDSE